MKNNAKWKNSILLQIENYMMKKSSLNTNRDNENKMHYMTDENKYTYTARDSQFNFNESNVWK